MSSTDGETDGPTDRGTWIKYSPLDILSVGMIIIDEQNKILFIAIVQGEI